MIPTWWRRFRHLTGQHGSFVQRSPKSRSQLRLAYRPAIEEFEDRLVPTMISIPTTGLIGGRGSTLQVPITVDSLSGTDVFNEPTAGLAGGQFVVYYNPAAFTVASVGIGTMTTGGNSSTVGKGYSPSTPNGWSVTSTTTSPSGYLYIDLGAAGNGSGWLTGAATGTLVVINFHVNNSAPLGNTHIDLAADSGDGASPSTSLLSYTSLLAYKLTDPPQDNSTLNPYFYNSSPADPDDGMVTITGVNQPPSVVNQSYSITERSVATDPALVVAAPGVLQGDTDPQSMALSASLGAVPPAHGTVTLNSDGSFVYTPNTGYLGSDSFTYVATDTNNNASTATVNLMVTPRLSLQASATSLQSPGPISLSGPPGGSVVIFVDVDDPNPQSSGGLNGANFYLDFDPSVFSVAPGTASQPSTDVQLGTLTSSGSWDLNTSVSPGDTPFNIGMEVLGVSLGGGLVTTQTPGSLVMITFHINPNAPSGYSPIILDPTSFAGYDNATLSCANSNSAYNFTLPLRPTLPDARLDADVDVIGESFGITAPVTATAGLPFHFTITALDASNNLLTGYTGTVHFASSDKQATLPPDATLTNGMGTFTATFLTSNDQTLTATDTIVATMAGRDTVDVSPAAPNHLNIAAPSSTTAGASFDITVTAQDIYGNTATNYAGTVHFSSSDTGASLPADTTLTGGSGTFSPTLIIEGHQTITVTDTAAGSIGSFAVPVVVNAVAANHFLLTAPSNATPGTPFTFTVTVQDPFYNTVTGFLDTVHFISSDPHAVLPPNSTLTAGTGTFTATLNTPGSQTLTAYDSAFNTITGRTGPILVSAPPAHLVVTVPTVATAGSAFIVTVTARDPLNDLDTAYGGVVHLSSTDTQAVLAPNMTLTGGVGFFAAILKTAGTATITATDTLSSGITATTAPISVSGLAASRFVVSAPASAITGNSVSFTVVAQDAFGNVASAYGGTVHFTTTDASAVLAASGTLTGGVGVFSAILKTPGAQTITATDASNAAITGTSNKIAALGLVVSSLTPTSTGFVATFNKPFDPTTINLYDTAGTLGSDDVLLTGSNAAQTSIHGSLIIDPSDMTITFVKTSVFTSSVNNFNPQTGVLSAGTYTVTFRSAQNGFKDLLGTPLDGTASGNPAGTNYTTTFVVAATPAEVVGVPGFARGPDSVDAINLPNNQNLGIPINLSDGTNVTSGSFTLQYNPALLNVTSATVNSTLPGASLTLASSSTPGNAVINFSSAAGLPPGVIRLGGLVATVPNSAAALYKSKALLHFSSVQLNGGALSVTGDDAVQVVAYFGDALGEGTLSGGDSALISRVAAHVDDNAAAGVIGGFAAYPLVDPVLIGDLTYNGSINAADVTLLNTYLTGTPRTQLPPIPTGLSIVTTGPDPSLSLPPLPPGGGRVGWGPGNTVIVPVNIDTARPLGSTGMTEAILALRFDPRVFSASPADVSLGTLPLASSPLAAGGQGGWQLTVAVNNQTGEIGIDLFGNTPIQTTAAGSLVNITLQVRATAPAGSTGLEIVSQVDPTGRRVYQTTVADSQGALVLHVASGQLAVDSGQQAVGSGQQAVGSDQWAVGSGDRGNQNAQGVNTDPMLSLLPTAHYPLLTNWEANWSVPNNVEQLAKQNGFGQPGAMLNEEPNGMGIEFLSDNALVQAMNTAQPDWIADDMLLQVVSGEWWAVSGER